jgi:hypothetical protein
MKVIGLYLIVSPSGKAYNRYLKDGDWGVITSQEKRRVIF